MDKVVRARQKASGTTDQRLFGLSDDSLRPSSAPATITIVAITCLVSTVAWSLYVISPEAGRAFERWLWNNSRLVTEEHWLWQIVTANFVHNGVIHLAVNLFFVVWLGPRLERMLGSCRFLGFYLGAGLFAYVINDLFGWISHRSITTGGASGCVLAIVVLHALSSPRYVVRLYGFFRVPFRWIVLLFVGSDVTSLFLRDGIPWVNHMVHLGGASFAAGYWFLSPRLRRRHVRI